MTLMNIHMTSMTLTLNFILKEKDDKLLTRKVMKLCSGKE